MLPPVYSPMEAKMEINSTDFFVGIFEFFTLTRICREDYDVFLHGAL